MRVFIEIELPINLLDGYGEIVDTDYVTQVHDCDITFKWLNGELKVFIDGEETYATMIRGNDDEDAAILQYAKELFDELGLELNRNNARMLKGLVNGIAWQHMRQATIAALLYQSYIFAEYFLI